MTKWVNRWCLGHLAADTAGMRFIITRRKWYNRGEWCELQCIINISWRNLRLWPVSGVGPIHGRRRGLGADFYSAR